MAGLRTVLLLAALLASAAARTHRGNTRIPHTRRGVDTDATAGLGAAVKRRLASSPYFNVEDYGAKGDNATDNTAAFNAAVSAASAAGGCVPRCRADIPWLNCGRAFRLGVLRPFALATACCRAYFVCFACVSAGASGVSGRLVA